MEGEGSMSRMDELSFRKAAGSFPSGVTIVTTTAPGGVAGMTVSGFSSLSLEPLMVIVTISEESGFVRMIHESGAFAVSVLAEGQEAVSMRFADPSRTIVTPSFEGLATRGEATGCPILSDAIAFMDCRLAKSWDAGDHTVIAGEVLAAGHREDLRPLAYWRGRYWRLAE
jgi:flavin reductase (DIM6/NTAB) family NADH-FMN oxidoreductase RutF